MFQHVTMDVYLCMTVQLDNKACTSTCIFFIMSVSVFRTCIVNYIDCFGVSNMYRNKNTCFDTNKQNCRLYTYRYNMDWSLVGIHVQVQHTALVDKTRKVQHRQRDSKGAAQAAVGHAPPSIAKATAIQLIQVQHKLL
jgi:hypothetical protein